MGGNHQSSDASAGGPACARRTRRRAADGSRRASARAGADTPAPGSSPSCRRRRRARRATRSTRPPVLPAARRTPAMPRWSIVDGRGRFGDLCRIPRLQLGAPFAFEQGVTGGGPGREHRGDTARLPDDVRQVRRDVPDRRPRAEPVQRVEVPAVLDDDVVGPWRGLAGPRLELRVKALLELIVSSQDSNSGVTGSESTPRSEAGGCTRREPATTMTSQAAGRSSRGPARSTAARRH